MRRALLSAAALTLLFSCGGRWQPLFDGESLEGWHVMNGGAKFEVQDGEIVGIAGDPSRNTFLVSDRTFSDFILEFDFKTGGINSGVQLRSHIDKERDMTYGYQFEIDPSDRAWSAGIYEEGGRGWLYRLYGHENAQKAYEKEEWNHARVEAVGNTIRTWLNGVPCSNLVDERESEGFIALQVHAVGQADMGKEVRWRNIRIMEGGELTPSSAPEISTLPNRLTEAETAEGWKLLWNGENLDGWRSASKDSLPSKGWKVKDGDLIVEAHNDSLGTGGGGDIVTRELFGNFILKVDFKLTPGANSGIKYFVDPLLEKGQGASIGCEFQVLDDNLHPDAKCGVDGNRTQSSLYDLIPAAKGEWGSYTVDGWNTAMIKVYGKHVEHWLNGVKVLEYDRDCDMWNALVAYSKYRTWKGTFGNFTEGRILLQDHNDEVHYRNVKILTF